MLFDVSSFPVVPFLAVKPGFYGIRKKKKKRKKGRKERRKRRERRRKKEIFRRLNAAPCPHAGVRENALVMEDGVNEDERVSMHFSFSTQILLRSPFTSLFSLVLSSAPLFPIFFFSLVFLFLYLSPLSAFSPSFVSLFLIELRINTLTESIAQLLHRMASERK